MELPSFVSACLCWVLPFMRRRKYFTYQSGLFNSVCAFACVFPGVFPSNKPNIANWAKSRNSLSLLLCRAPAPEPKAISTACALSWRRERQQMQRKLKASTRKSGKRRWEGQ